MQNLSIYVETSVWSHAFAEDAPESREATLEFFERATSLHWELAVSEVVLLELGRAPDPLWGQLQRLLEDVRPVEYELTEKARNLAEAYCLEGALPPAKTEDAEHVAVAVVNEFDILVSWNYRHLVNVRRRHTIQAVSAMKGYYKPLHIVTPPEVYDDRQ